MSKITFRADDDLVEEIESFDASKSEVLREALRSYIEAHGTPDSGETSDTNSLDALVADRVDQLIEQRLDERLDARRPTPQDVTVNVSIDDERSTVERKTNEQAETEHPAGGAPQCAQCGERIHDEYVHCPNCGEKTSKRAFCECGTELRSDWAFCPECGRRTPAADVLDPR